MNIIFSILSILLCVRLRANSKIIRTSLGEVNGAQIGNAHLFKRIPFSKPPIGNLRFQKPEPTDKWNGVLDATEYGPACMSNSSVTSSPQKWIDEDCLHLNIFTSDYCLTSKTCAVMIYIHGGNAEYDSAVMFNDTVLLDTYVARDIILVIPAFRLGIFSHFIVEDQSIAPNNLALYDLLESLAFVKREISIFGGDNQKITLMGHSSGGAFASVLTFSSKINFDLSLFQQAIIMSSNNDFFSYEQQLNASNTFVKHANCTYPKVSVSQSEKDRYALKCLQEKDAMELLRIQRQLEDAGYPGLIGIIQREPLFQEGPYSDFMNNPKNIPIMIGCSRFELDDQPEWFPIGIALGFENFEEVDVRFQRDKKEGKHDFRNHADETQAIMVQTKFIVDRMLENNVTTYLYEYAYPKHAKHTDDLFYLMGVHRFEMDENERQLSEVYKSMFINFAKFGEPRVDGFEAAQLENSTYFEVYWNETSGRRPEMKNGFEEEIIDYWFSEMVEYDKNITFIKNHLKKSNSPRFYIQSTDDYETNWKLFSLILIFSIFLAGCLFGRCIWPSKRNYYIRLDGNDHSDYNGYHQIKNF